MPDITEIQKQYPPVDTTDYRQLNNMLFKQLNKSCIVIDDDPTGNQTVYDIPLYSDWSVDTLTSAFRNKTPMFFLLTNSRSMTAEMAKSVYAVIRKNIQVASEQTGREYVIVSRSDSTLRGHFQEELEALEVDSPNNTITFFIPVMFEGGRVTVDGVHYLTEGKELIPVGETPFATDASFGYTSSKLAAWVEEKTKGQVTAATVHSFSLTQIREENATSLTKAVMALPAQSVAICDALCYHDLDKILHAILLAEQKGKQIRFRTSSSFLPSYIGQPTQPLLTANDLKMESERGGLVVVGSYVKKSSLQLAYLLKRSKSSEIIALDVERILDENNKGYATIVAEQVDKLLLEERKVILYTSRKLITGNSVAENLKIGGKVSAMLVNIVGGLKTNPRYILAKGGITSHDLAIKALKMKRGKVLGQILPGIPVWQLNENADSGAIPFIVFPGNVGNESAIYAITEKLKSI